jgi:hypothetical protein
VLGLLLQATVFNTIELLVVVIISPNVPTKCTHIANSSNTHAIVSYTRDTRAEVLRRVTPSSLQTEQVAKHHRFTNNPAYYYQSE